MAADESLATRSRHDGHEEVQRLWKIGRQARQADRNVRLDQCVDDCATRIWSVFHIPIHIHGSDWGPPLANVLENFRSSFLNVG